MRKMQFSSLWAIFVGVTFIEFLVTTILMTATVFLFFHLGLIGSEYGNPLKPIIFFLVLSSVVGTALFLFVGRIFVKPIKQLSEVSKEVAKGNFNVKIDNHINIPEVQDLAKNFNIMVHELSSIETLRTDFVANVSHEFKTPLAAIEGYVTLLQDKTLSESERDEYIRVIIDSVRQLSVLTENILSLSKLENQKIILDNTVFRLDEQLREAALLLENKWSEKNIELIIDLDKINYSVGKHLLRQVWLNLIDNAIKFTPAGGEIRISLTELNGEIIVTVADSGKGIKPDDISHIFDKFYQVSKSRKEAGNGLGLALVKRIVDLCQGTVNVESTPGSGSEFIVTLPSSGI